MSSAPESGPALTAVVPQPLLDVRDLHVTYPSRDGDVPAVRGVSFTLHPGETLGLAGESGCGKSSLASAVLKLLPAGTKVEGEVLLDGEDVLTMSPGRLRAVRWTEAAIVFQGAMHALNPVWKIKHQIAEAIQLHDPIGDKATQARIGELLEKVGLPGRRADAYPHQLSGGQRQRVMIAMALACNPHLLIADEPTTALDVMVQAQVLALLEQLQEDLGLAMVFITHDLSVLTSCCQRLAIMYAGRVVEEGPSHTVFAEPKHPYTKALAAAFPTIGDMRFRRAPLGLAGDPPDPKDLQPGCPFVPRCSEAIDACGEAEPGLMGAGPMRRAACIRVEDRP
jgi:peptide/nickel transport system ATP-binding protein